MQQAALPWAFRPLSGPLQRAKRDVLQGQQDLPTVVGYLARDGTKTQTWWLNSLDRNVAIVTLGRAVSSASIFFICVLNSFLMD